MSRQNPTDPYASMPLPPIPLLYGMQPFLMGPQMNAFYGGTKEFERFYKDMAEGRVEPKSENDEDAATSQDEVNSNKKETETEIITKFEPKVLLNEESGLLEIEDVKDPNLKLNGKDFKFIKADSSHLTDEQRAMYKSVLETWKPELLPYKKKRRYICDQCMKEFKNYQNLYLHVTRVHSNNDSSVLCDRCDRSFKNKHYLYMHRMNKHYDESERCTCQYCNQEFRTKRALHIHVKKCHPDTLPVLKCHECGKIFEVPYKLKYHIQRVHGAEDTKHQCHQCEKLFKTKLNLKKHLYSQHTVAPRHKCVFCESTFKTKHHMKRHVLNIHPPFESKVNCPQCGKEFKNDKYLKDHMLVHTSFEQQVPCDLCDKMFNSQTRLRKHKKIVHVDNPNYRCEICNRAFAHEHYLRRHQTSVHSDIQEEAYEHQCTLCLKRFKFLRYLNNHMKRHRQQSQRTVRRLKGGPGEGKPAKATGGSSNKRGRKKAVREEIEFIKCEPASSSSSSSDDDSDSE